MTFEEAKTAADHLDSAVKSAGEVLRQFPRSPLGLVSEETRKSPEYISAKRQYDIAFAKLRGFNAVFTRRFKKELANARRR